MNKPAQPSNQNVQLGMTLSTYIANKKDRQCQIVLATGHIQVLLQSSDFGIACECIMSHRINIAHISSTLTDIDTIQK